LQRRDCPASQAHSKHLSYRERTAFVITELVRSRRRDRTEVNDQAQPPGFDGRGRWRYTRQTTNSGTPHVQAGRRSTMSVPLQLTERSINGLVVLQLDGHLVFDEGDRILRDRVRSLVASGTRLLLLDLHGLSYIDSGGMGALVELTLHVARSGGRLALVCPSKCANRVMQITHVSTVFEIFQNEEQALRSMNVVAPPRPGAAVGRAS
jgi:anti-sigma B factor antagonist